MPLLLSVSCVLNTKFIISADTFVYRADKRNDKTNGLSALPPVYLLAILTDSSCASPISPCNVNNIIYVEEENHQPSKSISLVVLFAVSVANLYTESGQFV